MRVVLAEDDVLLREGIASLLERGGMAIVGKAGDGTGLLEAVTETAPDLVVTDIRMPPSFGTEGLDAAREIRRLRPDVAIVVLSAHVNVEHAIDLLISGRGVGYLLKQRVTEVDEFLRSITAVAAGGAVIDPALVAELVAVRKRDDPLDALSPREREVLSLMAEGRSNAGIARQLWLAEGTVEKHVRSIMIKLSIGEGHDDHRRVLAVLAYLGRR